MGDWHEVSREVLRVVRFAVPEEVAEDNVVLILFVGDDPFTVSGVCTLSCVVCEEGDTVFGRAVVPSC